MQLQADLFFFIYQTGPFKNIFWGILLYLHFEMFGISPCKILFADKNE